MNDASAIPHMMFFSPQTLIAHFVMRMAAPVFSSTVPIVHPRNMTIATLLIVPENPLLIVPSIFSHGVPRPMARTIAAIRMPNPACSLYLDISTIISTMTIAKTANT